jgi:hypothetical protein
MRLKIEDTTRQVPLVTIDDGTVIRFHKDANLYLVGSGLKRTASAVHSRNVVRLSDGKTRWVGVDQLCVPLQAKLTIS